MKVISLRSRVVDNARWPVDCLLKQIDDYDEVLILAKVAGEERYTRFASGFKSTFWWVGVLEAVKRTLMDESLRYVDID